MRLFVALDLPPAIRAALGQLVAESTRLGIGGVRWVRPESMHITLKFIGYIEDDRVAEFRAALVPVRSDSPIDMEVRGVGFFPNPRRPRVMWCGLNATPNLKQLAADVEAAVATLGIAPESREFLPHLTLARIDAPASTLKPLVAAAEEHADAIFGSTRQTELHLYESVLKRSGAEYRKIETYRFTKDAD